MQLHTGYRITYSHTRPTSNDHVFEDVDVFWPDHLAICAAIAMATSDIGP